MSFNLKNLNLSINAATLVATTTAINVAGMVKASAKGAIKYSKSAEVQQMKDNTIAGAKIAGDIAITVAALGVIGVTIVGAKVAGTIAGTVAGINERMAEKRAERSDLDEISLLTPEELAKLLED